MARMQLDDRRLNSPTAVTFLVLAFYLLFSLAAMIRHDWDPLWFVWLGERSVNGQADGRMGYDGQFIYYLAQDGPKVLSRLDNPVYRLQRILLPLVVGLLSLGRPGVIVWLLPLINLAAISATTFLLARWLAGQGRSPWYALIYAGYVGVLMAYSRDLTEPLALFLATLGVLLWQRGRLFWAAAALALGALTKEIMLIFIVGIVAVEFLNRRFRAAAIAAAAAGPLLIWQLFLLWKLGEMPLVSGPSLELIPLVGILPHLTSEPGRLSAFFLAGLPALILLPYGIWQLWRGRGRSAAAWWLVLNALLVLLMPFGAYNHIMHAGRNAAGLVLAFLFVLPGLPRPARLLSLAYWTLPSLIWLIPILRWAPWLSEL